MDIERGGGHVRMVTNSARKGVFNDFEPMNRRNGLCWVRRVALKCTGKPNLFVLLLKLANVKAVVKVAQMFDGIFRIDDGLALEANQDLVDNIDLESVVLQRLA